MDKSLREKSKEELKALLEYLEKAKIHINETLENGKKIYDSLIEKYESVRKEMEKRYEK